MNHNGDAVRQIVLTGVSRGLGLALARAFAAAGHHVCGCARQSPELDAARLELGPPHTISAVDVSSDRDVHNWAAESLARCRVPDLLINNAAVINRNAKLWDIDAEEFDRSLAINVSGTANVLRHFLPAMVAQRRGVIVNLSSGWGRSVSAEVAPYCATKWAIEGLTQALAEELPDGMAAIPLNPGIVDTDMLRSCFASGAAAYPSPTEWAQRAAPFILALGSRDNGHSLTVPD